MFIYRSKAYQTVMYDVISLGVGALLLSITWVAALDAWRAGMKPMSVVLLSCGIVSVFLFNSNIETNISFIVLAVLPGALYYTMFREKEKVGVVV
jgi:hypothetical protein